MGRMQRNFTASAIAAGLMGLLITGPVMSAGRPDMREAKDIAKEGFVYGLPLGGGLPEVDDERAMIHA